MPERNLLGLLLHCWSSLRWNTRAILIIGFLAFVSTQLWVHLKYQGPSSAKLQFLPPAYSTSRCGSTFVPSIRSLPSLPTLDRNLRSTLVVYNYYTSEGSSDNFRFFLSHALHNRADTQFLIVLSASPCNRIPDLPNIGVWSTPSSLYGFAAIRHALEELNLTTSHDQYILLGSWVRGPFMPIWSHQCWTDAFSRLLQNNVHLVGTTHSCMDADGHQMPHLHPTAWAVTRTALSTLLSPFTSKSIRSSNSERTQMLNANLIRKAGWEVKAISPGWPSNPDLDCTQDWNFKPHPYETIFVNPRLPSYVKYNPQDEDDFKLVQFVDQSTTSMKYRKYDSNAYCR